MKCLSLSLVAIAMLAYPAGAQESNPVPPSSVGLIDMAHVFQKYDKFEQLRNTLQAEIQQSDVKAKEMVERMQKGQQEIKKFNAGSPEYERAEKGLLEQKGEFDAFRASTQRRLARRESEMFKVIYSDVTAAVEKYAKYKRYTMVLRFNRKGIDEEMNPQEAVQTMNKTVIYHQGQNDITDVVLGYLNAEYKKSGGTVAPTAGAARDRGTPARSASKSRRVNQ